MEKMNRKLTIIRSYSIRCSKPFFKGFFGSQRTITRITFALKYYEDAKLQKNHYLKCIRNFKVCIKGGTLWGGAHFTANKNQERLIMITCLRKQWRAILAVPDLSTDSIKINRSGHNILMYWNNFWQPTILNPARPPWDGSPRNPDERRLLSPGFSTIW